MPPVGTLVEVEAEPLEALPVPPAGAVEVLDPPPTEPLVGDTGVVPAGEEVDGLVMVVESADDVPGPVEGRAFAGVPVADPVLRVLAR